MYVFAFSWNGKSEKKWKQNNHLFLDLIDKHKNDERPCRFVLIDADVNPEYLEQCPTIIQYVNGQVYSNDVLQDNLELADLSLCESLNIETCLYPPNNRVSAKLPCPGSLNGGRCEHTKHYWVCKTCKNEVEYGFDGYFYCSCGKSKAENYKFRCSSKHHDFSYMTYPQKTLQAYLAQHRPLDEMNILILGETGVGKSTWINAFANYIRYESLEEAKNGELISIIPSSFTMTDENFNEIEIKIGGDKNESFVKGQSATQYPKAYVIRQQHKIIRLLDTPGIGDTRGIEKDKENMENILTFLSHYNEIHGICILLKPNHARLTTMFNFCIKELLAHLHKSAARNIVFCFTHGRSTFYRPGGSIVLLKQLLSENPDVEIALSKHTMYVLDNEAFRFLAAFHSNKINFNEQDVQDYSRSWIRSISEIARLLKHVEELKPHKIKDTLSLNDARRLILRLTKPIAEISQNIQANIGVIEKKKKEIKEDKEYEKNLSKKLKVPFIELERRTLDHPRTVCTSEKCTEVFNYKGVSQILYKTHCHTRCYLHGVPIEKLPEPKLLNCAAMGGTNSCKRCGCHWTKHMHINYETYRKKTMVVDETIKKLLKSNKTEQEKKEEHIKNLEKRIEKFKDEQKIITEASATFACFLKYNAIAPYNDALAEYLNLLIKKEKQIARADEESNNQDNIEGLENMKREYEEQVRILNNAMNNKNNNVNITPAAIKALEQKLLNLEFSGTNLKEILKGGDKGKKEMYSYHEKTISPPQYKRKSKKKTKEKDFFETVKEVKEKVDKGVNKVKDYLGL